MYGNSFRASGALYVEGIPRKSALGGARTGPPVVRGPRIAADADRCPSSQAFECNPNHGALPNFARLVTGSPPDTRRSSRRLYATAHPRQPPARATGPPGSRRGLGFEAGVSEPDPGVNVPRFPKCASATRLVGSVNTPRQKAV